MQEKKAFTPIKTGPVELKNRFVMAPMTRNRADNEHEAPVDLHVEYYKQRTSAGLIITEGSQISKEGRGYMYTAGIYNEEQVEGWQKVTDAVHKNNGKIQIQLWHTGRVSHPYFHDGGKPIAPSAIRADSKAFIPSGFVDTTEPRALTTDEVQEVIKEFGRAAARAERAGFDGAQIHGANGYLIEQFLHDSSNKRSDKYGGNVENRSRFLFEVIEAVANEIGEDRTSVRLSPSNLFNTNNDSHSRDLYEYIISKLNSYNLAFLELVEPLDDVSDRPELVNNVTKHFRPVYKGVLATNGKYGRKSGIEVIESGTADLVSYAKLFLANPDLVERLKRGARLNEPDPDTFYGGGEKGYTDYPFLEETAAAE